MMNIITETPMMSELNKIDWNFPNSVMHNSIHNMHPYPAKFIPEIPKNIIQTLCVDKKYSILDPFCGSGTTLIEAQRLGYTSVGIDLNPIACLISKVKTNYLPRGLVEIAQNCVLNARELKNPMIPEIPSLNHWFQNDIQKALAALRETIATYKETEFYDALRLTLSAIIVRVSNQESDTRYAAIKKDVTPEALFDLFINSAIKLENTLTTEIECLPPSKIINKNILEVRSSDISLKVGAVITSPPYPNAYEYWLYHKYRMWWLEFDPLFVKEKEIGARAHYFKKDSPTPNDFKKNMSQTFNLIRTVLIDGGYICFVIGRSKIHGEIINNAKLINAAANDNGFNLVYSTERKIAPSRKSFNLSHAKIKKESLLIFQ
ncbi:class I SAM-dependent methyltransferase [Chitinispirillales bacterium ANBcel5]|uniref:DNA methyltransferase n=1 Tax=Cellulosispirillum alkaliphilum TaxID=3039283 RepID=UPI002A4E7187|nr:class I SAM-dependent methyltransferase [Chitinispirillales bacterium ANBcel5]